MYKNFEYLIVNFYISNLILFSENIQDSALSGDREFIKIYNYNLLPIESIMAY